MPHRKRYFLFSNISTFWKANWKLLNTEISSERKVGDISLGFLRNNRVSDPTVLWRYDDALYGQLCLREFHVLRETPRGCWIEVEPGQKKFVLATAHKRHAYPTKAEALASFIKRKTRQITILSKRLALAQENLRIAKGTAL